MLDQSPRNLGAELQRASRMWRDRFTQVLEQQGIAAASGAAGDLLDRIEPAGMSQKLLTERMALSKQAVQQLLDRLEALGAIAREPDPADRRHKRIRLTDTGSAIIAARQRAARRIDDEMLALLGRKRLGRLRKTLRRLARAGTQTPKDA